MPFRVRNANDENNPSCYTDTGPSSRIAHLQLLRRRKKGVKIGRCTTSSATKGRVNTPLELPLDGLGPYTVRETENRPELACYEHI